MKKRTKRQLSQILYNKKLAEIEKQTGDKSTYLSQLNSVGRGLLRTKFRGVFPSDKIPKLNEIKPYCILNVDRSGEPGSHWVALARMDNGDTLFYDSFGRDGNKLIKNLEYSGNGRIVNTDDDVEQKMSETNCGARCLSFLCICDEYGADVAKLI